MRILTAILLTTVLATPAAARDREFDDIVHRIESHYHTRRTWIPFLGLANLVVKAAQPYGARGFKLAIFENLHCDGPCNPVDIPDLSPDWQKVIRMISKRNGEVVHIYARPNGDRLKMMIVTAEPHEAVVVQVDVQPEELARQVEKARRHSDRVTD